MIQLGNAVKCSTSFTNSMAPIIWYKIRKRNDTVVTFHEINSLANDFRQRLKG